MTNKLICKYNELILDEKTKFRDLSNESGDFYKIENKNIIMNDTMDAKLFVDIILDHPSLFKVINFRECLFEKVLYFPSIIFDKYHSRTAITELTFENCIFKHEVIIEDRQIDCQIIFNNCIFLDTVNLKSSIFSSYIDFSNSIFCNGINLELTSFDDIANFKDAKLINKCQFNLRDSYINGKIFFLDIKSFNNNVKVDYTLSFESNYKKFNNEMNDKYLNVKNRETARIIKDSFEQQNNIIEANRFYALEMKEREKELKWGKDFFEKLIFSIHGWSSNHSQDWLLALFWILNIAFITSFVGTTVNEKASVIHFIDRTLFLILSITVTGIILFSIRKYIGNWALFLITGFMYMIHVNLTDNYSLDNIANCINPFSVMNNWDNISFNELIFKIIIAYLIYQLIISIRQNTRRK